MNVNTRWNLFATTAVALLLLVPASCAPPVAVVEPSASPADTEFRATDSPPAPPSATAEPTSSPTATEFRPTDTPSTPPVPEAEGEATSVPFPPTEKEVAGDQGEVGTLVAIARADLARRLSVPDAEITIQSVEEVMWPNAGLGCPQPGYEYIQVITPGYKILLAASGRTYSYHANPGTLILLCTKGTPELPIISIE